MEELTVSGREGISVRIGALLAARDSLREGAPGAVDSIRRLAHSMAGFGRTYGLSDVEGTAKRLETCSDENLMGFVEELFALLRDYVPDEKPRKGAILIVDDDQAYSRLVGLKLASTEREILTAKTCDEAVRIVDSRNLSLVILDLTLPDGDGRDLLIRIRESSSGAAVPVIVLTGKAGTQPKTECFALGADEYLEKPVEFETLAALVSAKVERAGEITRETQRDTLTKLTNRKGLAVAFERSEESSAESEFPSSIGIIDFDRFKSINDSYGHDAGDEVLRRAATVIRKSFRRGDVLCRWGGDEFVAFFPATGLAEAIRALERALDLIRAETFIASDQRTFQVTFSAGAMLVAPDATLDSAVAVADRWLQRAKESGKNRIVSSLDNDGDALGGVPPPV